MSLSLNKDFSQIDIWTLQNVYDKSDIIKRIDQLYPYGLSEHGIQYLIRQGLVIFKSGTRGPLKITHTAPMIEAIFEILRRNEFTNRPSRMQSIFAWLNLDDARKFCQSQRSNFKIYEVESDRAFIADLNLLYLGGSVIGSYELARKYWSGEKRKNYLLEAVIPLPVMIGAAI